MKKVAVIVAGGTGQRMGAEVPKQFLLIKGRPLLQYTLRTFLDAFADLQIILVLPALHLEKGKEIVAQMNVEERVQLVGGGDTRFHSVQKGLQLIIDPSVIFVHDGVRCLVSKQLITNCYAQTMEKGSAIPSVAPADSLRIETATGYEVINRDKVRIIQTPQTFTSDILLPAFKQPYQPSFTDEATVVESWGQKVFLIEGEYTNFKITRPIDLYVAEQMLEDNLLFKEP